ncbi:MAG: hypothetical protein UHE93_04365, partial [Muribaculaceae bacterium]|nr:hypothetical protein [Muribaculaceae bacterium]
QESEGLKGIASLYNQHYTLHITHFSKVAKAPLLFQPSTKATVPLSHRFRDETLATLATLGTDATNGTLATLQRSHAPMLYA